MGMLQEFKTFALRGNLIDMAVGFTVGAAFTTVAKSIVDNLIMPPVGLAMGGADFSDLFLVLAEGRKEGPYETLAAAQAAGAVTLNFGLFVNALLSFLIVAFVMFMLIRAINSLEKKMESEPQTERTELRKCPFCVTTISIKATRCAACTSELPAPVAPASTVSGS